MSWNGNVITLTDLTETDEFKQLSSELDMPPVGIKPAEVTPPRKYHGMEYALVGMAIDYLLRFELQREYQSKNIYTGDLVAENAVHFDDKLKSDVTGLLASAKAISTAYVNGAETVPTKEVLDLARLENIVRGGTKVIDSVDAYLGQSDDDMETDLEQMRQLAMSVLTVDDYAVLNPVLANRGIVADADMIVDDALIDIKTTINPEFTQKFWRQLIGYLILLDIQEDIGGSTHGWEITAPKKFGVYFSRSGDLTLLSTEPVYNHQSYPELREFVEQRFM